MRNIICSARDLYSCDSEATETGLGDYLFWRIYMSSQAERTNEFSGSS